MCLDASLHAACAPVTQDGAGAGPNASSDLPALARRGFLVALVGTSGAVLAGCVGPNETGFGLNLVSPEQVTQLGLQSWAELRSQTPASNNGTYQQALREVGSRVLAANGENPAAWEMVVFQGDEANAFMLPGNKIGVYEGLFQYARDPDQFAAVLGHELAHNQAGHPAERLSSEAASQLGLQLAGGLLQAGNVGNAAQIAALLGAGVEYGLILPYSRNQELEADRLGLFNAARAGYDPRAAIALWQNMSSAGSRPPGFLSTHPDPADRISQLQALMPEALSLYQGA